MTPDACSACSFSRSACSCCVSACDSMLRSAAQPDSADDALNACPRRLRLSHGCKHAKN